MVRILVRDGYITIFAGCLLVLLGSDAILYNGAQIHTSVNKYSTTNHPITTIKKTNRNARAIPISTNS